VYLHKLLNLKYTNDYKKPKKGEDDKPHPLDIFRKIKRCRTRCNVNELEIHNDEILNDFIPLPHISLIREEGIMPWTCEEFNVGYSPKHRRICFPERFWAGDKNSYLGVIGRTVIKEYEMLDICKYLPVGNSFPKGMNLYGLNENYEHIQAKKVVVATESQKSVLKRHSRGDKIVVSLGGHVITDEQKRILISLDTEIVIALDKDISLNQIRAECEKFYHIRNVSYIYDRWNLLKEKESPCDKENKIYEFMFKFRTKYDEKEHKEYQKYLKGGV
jgi:shikimate kinase